MVIGCGLPEASTALNSSEAVQLAGLLLEMSTRHTLPCRSPAYSTFAPESPPLLLITVTAERPFGALVLQALVSKLHRLIFAATAPVCGLSA